MKRIILWIFGAAMLMLQLSSALKADDLSNVESVLDRLEKRLLDQEADTLTFDERQQKRSRSKKKAVTKYKFKGGTIDGLLPEEAKLKELAEVITELESEVDMLSSKLSRTKQTIVDDSLTRNSVSFEASLIESDYADIRSVYVSMDGYRVYELNDKTGTWLPNAKLPVYFGPMQPGSHKLRMEVRVSMKNKDGISLNNSVYKFTDKTFDFHIPEGAFEKSWVVEIKAPEKLDGPLTLKMKEGKIRPKSRLKSSDSVDKARLLKPAPVVKKAKPSLQAVEPLVIAPKKDFNKKVDQVVLTPEEADGMVPKASPGKNKVISKTTIKNVKGKKRKNLEFQDISGETK